VTGIVAPSEVPKFVASFFVMERIASLIAAAS
jgi:hypothetical protein